MRVSLLLSAGLLLAAVLSGCGGGGPAASSATATGSSTASATISVADPVAVTLADGHAVPAMADALLVGEQIVVRSRSASYITVNHKPAYAGTRFSVLDKQGRLVSSTDYGFTLAAGYTGEWLMMPAPTGFILIQASRGSRLLHFDAQARLLDDGTDLYPAVAATSTTAYAAAENGGAVDGNGFWLATTFSLLPVTDKTQYLLKLCKFDFNGKQLTPPFTISTSALHPRVAAAGGTALAGWLEGGGAMLAMWPKGAGAPIIRSLATGGAQPYPLALNASGRMGVLWNGKATTSTVGGVMGVALDSSAVPVLASGHSDLTLETLSSNWNGTVRVSEIDAHAYRSGISIAGSMVASFRTGDPMGDVLVLADYALGAGPLSAQAPVLLRFTLPGGAALGPAPMLRQMLFGDHSVLLAGDDNGLLAFIATRNP